MLSDAYKASELDDAVPSHEGRAVYDPCEWEASTCAWCPLEPEAESVGVSLGERWAHGILYCARQLRLTPV